MEYTQEQLNEMFNNDSLKVKDSSEMITKVLEVLHDTKYFTFKNVNDTVVGMYVATYQDWKDYNNKDINEIKTLHLFKIVMPVKIIVENQETTLPAGSLIKINSLTMIDKALSNLNKGSIVAIRFSGQKKLKTGMLKQFDVRGDSVITPEFKEYADLDFDILTLMGYRNGSNITIENTDEEGVDYNEEVADYSKPPFETTTSVTPSNEVDLENLDLNVLDSVKDNPTYKAILALAEAKFSATADTLESIIKEKTDLDVKDENKLIEILTKVSVM